MSDQAQDSEDLSATALAERLAAVVGFADAALRGLDDSAFAARARPNGWSGRELVGHLIDSASNNHQRFVRAAFVEHLDFPGYDQDAWVELQDYASAPAQQLVQLWSLYNRQLARVVRRLSADALARPREIHALDRIAWSSHAADEPATLAWFVSDYIGHLEYHLRQLGTLLDAELVSG